MNRIEQAFQSGLKSDIRIKKISSANLNNYISFLPKTEKINLAYGVQSTGGTPRGAAAALAEDNVIEIKSLFVKEDDRRAKVGSSLLRKIKEYADENDIDTVTAEYLADGADKTALDAFYRSNGFIVKDGMELISFNASDVADNATYKKLSGVSMDDFKYYRINQLPDEAKKQFAEMCASPEVSELSPAYAKGALLDELSLAYVNGSEVKAFVVITDLNGKLYINSAYADPTAPTAIVKLITIALKTVLEKYTSYTKICVSALNEASLKFIMSFIGNDSGKTEKIYTTAAVYSISAVLAENGNFEDADADILAKQTTDGMEILVPRTMRLSDFLTQEGVQCDLTILDDGLPAVLVTNDGGISIVRYSVTGDGFDTFNITAYSYFNIGDKDANELCASFNGKQSATAVPAEDNSVIVSAVLAEGAIPVSENQFVFFWNTFNSSVNLFALLCSGENN